MKPSLARVISDGGLRVETQFADGSLGATTLIQLDGDVVLVGVSVVEDEVRHRERQEHPGNAHGQRR